MNEKYKSQFYNSLSIYIKNVNLKIIFYNLLNQNKLLKNPLNKMYNINFTHIYKSLLISAWKELQRTVTLDFEMGKRMMGSHACPKPKEWN